LPQEPPPANEPPPSSAAIKLGRNATEGEQGADIWYGLRVAVEPSPRDPNLFVVRRLEAKQPVPAGSREALIVVLDSGADLFGSAPALARANKAD